ncbi:MAG: hypothetical protein C0190_04745 [Thermodesulfobacterium geofontis]|uniref:J domain-containing protein n=1 Tax=Thermodesulfobacterium geofontis TaxID=1295609 RepID=A0A2N7PMZ5_9BACT|nr:MAG: hypothetical protein C0190_04745 [Thermodesulfobacterium geofontis]
MAIFELSYISSRASQEDIDRIFINNFCGILKDETFRMGMSSEELHENYFCRYVWLYFDSVPFFPKPREFYIKVREIYFKAFKILGIPEDELKRMGRKELLRIFRREAKKLHPDKGGSHEKFIELRKIFEELLRLKRYE